MSEQAPPSIEKKLSNSESLRQIVLTFSDEAQAAAKRKAIEQLYPLDRGAIPFEETLINLSRNRDILLKSIDDGAIPQLPLKIQETILNDARKVSAQLSNLQNGSDSVIPFETTVDDLTSSIWTSRLENMSGVILGFHEKLNQLKVLERSLRELNQRAETFKVSEQRASAGLERLDQALVSVEGSVGNLAKIVETSEGQLEAAKSAQSKIEANLASSQQSEKSASESAATTRAASGEVDSLRTRATAAVNELEQTRAAYVLLTNQLDEFKAQVQSTLTSALEDHQKAYDKLNVDFQAELKRITTVIEEKEALSISKISSTLTTSVEGFAVQSATLAAEFRTAESARAETADREIKQSEARYKKHFEELEEKAADNISSHNQSVMN